MNLLGFRGYGLWHNSSLLSAYRLVPHAAGPAAEVRARSSRHTDLRRGRHIKIQVGDWGAADGML